MEVCRNKESIAHVLSTDSTADIYSGYKGNWEHLGVHGVNREDLWYQSVPQEQEESSEKKSDESHSSLPSYSEPVESDEAQSDEESSSSS